MDENQVKINQLLEKLNALLKKHEAFSNEIDQLREEIKKINRSETTDSKKSGDKIQPQQSEIEPNLYDQRIAEFNKIHPKFRKHSKQIGQKTKKIFGIKSDLEKFIGENLINKIGIVIIIIGVGIGVKYAIDHQLITPVTRIILGYLSGLVLLGFSIRLKKQYENFSAVLYSGSMAIIYFITFFACTLYDLIPQTLAFFMMVLLTVFTVAAAIIYNQPIIALIGLVGAYTTPFLLREGFEKAAFLFGYMTVINVGIFVISFKKYWKNLYYSSFVFTWLIYLSWYASKYHTEESFGISLISLVAFFLIFYLTFLSYKLIRNEKFKLSDIFLLLINSIAFYGIGYSILNNHSSGEHLLGLYTLCNALIHFIVSAVIYRKKHADQNLMYFVSGLGIVFVTIAIPVQLEGNWVTLLWAGEAASLFRIGRTKKIPLYEKLSYPLMLLAFFSIIHDWDTVYSAYNPAHPYTRLTPIFNVSFLTSILFIVSFGMIYQISLNKKYLSPFAKHNKFAKGIYFSIPIILLIVLYYSFKLEIANYWHQKYLDSAIEHLKNGNQKTIQYNFDLIHFKTIWDINYSLLFFSVLSIINNKKFKSRILGLINLGLSTYSILGFLILGLYEISELRESYLDQILAEYYNRGIFNLLTRYISYVFAGGLIYVCYKTIQQEFLKVELKMAFGLFLHLVLLWTISSEMINWMDIFNCNQPYLLGLSILWGIYALFLIALGIWKQKKYLRIGAIVLFTVTLLKLFFYDLTRLETISKTTVLILLGVLLLIISFLYNKYKHIITENNGTNM